MPNIAHLQVDSRKPFSVQKLFTLVHGQKMKMSTRINDVWKLDKNSPALIGAGGNSVAPSAGFPCAGHQGCLVFERVNQGTVVQVGYWKTNDEVFHLGSGGSAEGDYRFQMNDDILSDNDGYIWLDLEDE